jgi:hypothetical protein
MGLLSTIMRIVRISKNLKVAVRSFLLMVSSSPVRHKKEPANEPILYMMKDIECVGRTRTTVIPSAIIRMQMTALSHKNPAKNSEPCFNYGFLKERKIKKRTRKKFG